MKTTQNPTAQNPCRLPRQSPPTHPMPFRPTLLRRCSHDCKITSFKSAVSAPAASPPPSPPAGTVPAARTPAAYNALMSAYSVAGRSDEVIRLFRSLPFAPTAPLYTTLISSLAVSGCHHAAFASLLRSGLPLTSSAFTALLKLHSAASIDSWYSIVRAMDALGCSPDAAVYNCLILMLCNYQQVEEALGVLDLMADNGVYPTVRSYTAILKCYCEQGKVLHAQRFVDGMIEVGCLPDVVSYSVLIEGLCSVGEFSIVERILGESEERGWAPNPVTYNIYMSALCRMGFADEAFQQFCIMQKRGLSPTVETVNILFDCLCRGSRFTEAESLLEHSELGWDVDVFCYNTLMSRLCHAGAFPKVLKLLVDLLKKGIGPDVFSFTIAIRSLCRAGKLRVAKCLMENEGIGYDVVAFNTLIHGFFMAGDMQSARLTYNYMISRNVLPNEFSKSMVIDSYSKEQNFGAAVNFFLEYSGHPYVHDHFVRLNSWLVKARQLSYVRYLLDEVWSRGFALDVCIFDSLVRIFCFEGYCKHEIEIVSRMLDNMLRKIS